MDAVFRKMVDGALKYLFTYVFTINKLDAYFPLENLGRFNGLTNQDESVEL